MELGNEIYEIPESIFNPSIIEMETNNLPQTVVDSINKCDISTRKELFNNIVLGGGNTLLKGFEARLKTGIEEIKKRNCGIISLKERNYSSWIGGSGISSISNFSNKWIARNEYLDSGEKLFETNYLFNYGGIVGGKGRSIKSGDIREESEIYKKMLMNE
jgi:actin-related protein